MTTITITDPELVKQLAAAKGPVEFRDAAGNVIHSTDGPGLWAPPEGYVPPIPAEELDRRRATYRGGMSLAEAWKRIRGEA